MEGKSTGRVWSVLSALTSSRSKISAVEYTALASVMRALQILRSRSKSRIV